MNSVAHTKGADYYFEREVFEKAPEDILESVVARELAHAVDVMRDFDKALKEFLSPDRAATALSTPVERARRQILELEERGLVEDGAADRAVAWGFDIQAGKKWCRGNIK